MSARDGALSLVAHTVAARLFAPGLTSRHLAFCARLAAAVPVRELTYPRRADIAPQVAAVIEADLATNRV
jgi:hypothetical protein